MAAAGASPGRTTARSTTPGRTGRQRSPASAARCGRYNPATGTIIAPKGTPLHRRLDAILLGDDPGRRQAVIGCLLGGNENRRAGLQEARIAGTKGDHRGIGSDQHFGSAVLVS